MQFFFEYYVWAISITFIHLFLHFHLYIFSILTFFETQMLPLEGSRHRQDFRLQWKQSTLELSDQLGFFMIFYQQLQIEHMCENTFHFFWYIFPSGTEKRKHQIPLELS